MDELRRRRFWSNVVPEPNSGCWLWDGPVLGDGYGVFNVGTPSKKLRAHRVSYALSAGPVPRGLFVCHHCDVKLCVNPRHLYAGTHQDNVDDMTRRGRGRNPVFRGTANHKSRLTPSAVAEIRRLVAQGVSQAALARRYGVARQSVHAVVHGRSWAHAGELTAREALRRAKTG